MEAGMEAETEADLALMSKEIEDSDPTRTEEEEIIERAEKEIAEMIVKRRLHESDPSWSCCLVAFQIQ